MGAFSGCNPRWGPTLQSLGSPYTRRRFLSPLLRDGCPRYDPLRLFGSLAFLSFCTRIFRRSLGIPRDSGNLVGELVTGLYVFQSIMVPRTLGLRERTLLVVLASNARRANIFSVGYPGSAVRSNRQCVLPEWRVAACPVDGRVGDILEGLEIAGPQSQGAGSALRPTRGLHFRVCHRAAANLDLP